MSQTISRPSTVLFSNEWVTVDTVPAVTASGKVYQHMRVTPRTGLGVVVVPYAQMLGTTYVGMIQQDRPAINARTPEFPRGSVDAGRTVEEMAIIELSQKNRRHTARPPATARQTASRHWPHVYFVQCHGRRHITRHYSHPYRGRIERERRLAVMGRTRRHGVGGAHPVWHHPRRDDLVPVRNPAPADEVEQRPIPRSESGKHSTHCPHSMQT